MAGGARTASGKRDTDEMGEMHRVQITKAFEARVRRSLLILKEDLGSY